jgi:uncharacterized protein (TIGR04222 family)
MRRWLIGILLALVTLPAIAHAQDRSFVWQRIESDVTVQQDGRVHVRETLTLRYEGGPFTFAYRDMPTDYLERVSNISVRNNERAFTPTDDDESETPFTFFVEDDERGQRVRWVYPPTENTTRTFVVEYDVAGAVTRDGNNATVRWPIVFADRDEVVEAAIGRVRVPGDVSADQIAATFANRQGTIETGANEAIAQVRDVAPGEDVYIQIQFPGSVVTSEQPAWRAAERAQAQYDVTLRPLVDLAVSLVTLVAASVLSWSLVRWWRANRDPQPQFVSATDAYFPPDHLQPALAARLLGNDGGALQSTLFDLANRGYLRFAQVPGGRWQGKLITAISTGKSVHDLERFEQAALEALFGNEPQVELSKRHSALMGASSKIKDQHTHALVERGYLSPKGLARRRRGMTIGGLLLGIGLVALVPAFIFAARYSWWLLALAGVMTLLGLIWLIMAAAEHGVSQRGADAAQQWRAFGAYVAELQPATAPSDQFSRLLPYATALGPGISKLTKAYKQSAEPLPAWYQPASANATLAASAATVLLLRDWTREWDGFNASFVASSSASGGGGSGGGGGGSGGGGAG